MEKKVNHFLSYTGEDNPPLSGVPDSSEATKGKSGGAFFGSFSDVLGGVGGLFSNIFGGISAWQLAKNTTQTITTDPQQDKNRTTMIIGIGIVAVLIIVVVLAFAFKRQ